MTNSCKCMGWFLLCTVWHQIMLLAQDGNVHISNGWWLIGSSDSRWMFYFISVLCNCEGCSVVISYDITINSLTICRHRPTKFFSRSFPSICTIWLKWTMVFSHFSSNQSPVISQHILFGSTNFLFSCVFKLSCAYDIVML